MSDLHQKIRQQRELAVAVCDDEDFAVTELLDALASCGIKLTPLTEGDFDEKGVSILTYAYLNIGEAA